MTRADVIEMARRAGIETVLPAPKGQVEALELFAALVASRERDECYHFITNVDVSCLEQDQELMNYTKEALHMVAAAMVERE